ncbi:bifunctional tRNA (5-methylaminomethyl-2-thiouridine)(34)-methyltransferase MnmD/FAD-dependent 5-carboxymethylaminomethyl-2-thiouridine(34) oxidoreductase MnmC [Microbulbifer salipaludis]|uniref:tRNA 5-methylaminomethyl-2-thiouridine biosynthesis bifunctional protein MnmC n=1 Tax=Microbulbifer salipaludis TaxID=187980 RepID=A0ABS3E779_9GAMM|nr:bifunctional tRNA (5-methylaminomethyl-2-thiouridine)(34)-methyltransferase MnmD/FAD-dependent 5-carboxymethylaminomethyl-2-thiouridine(34) oxidoreductase MnmC [Microbulbifer salipaludis]MBN8430919.1 bifunctional tRNA (5-methylaminomethyl-2-thiouridine)(34)-methyltransferase MnmD/FAD-dependent 5-carboxymethylaminomethyl-2-thiouridine(34) oxidoreductase MnmC [Microbulbifer salipaludis]
MPDNSKPPVHHAQLEWRENGQPASTAFDDIYFSTASGLEETRHVFLAQNQLAQRWSALESGARFTIGETGFGTGLNFLAAWQLWRQLAPTNGQLHFVSVEKFPLHPEDLARALAMWPELADLSDQLIAQYPDFLAAGVHRLRFPHGVYLTLIIDEASQGFEQLRLDDPGRDRVVDAWFLDGFAPAKNPDMWSEALFQAIANLSAPHATFATFTCAGIVKRGLKSAGFSLHKVPGFGRKREMLRGDFAPPANEAPHSHAATPWHLPPSNLLADHLADQATEPAAPQSVAIIGAGIAGAAAARALAERNLNVTVFEQGPAPGSGASGNDQGILYAKLSPKPGPNGDFNLLALQFAQRFYPTLCPHAVHFDGLLQLAQTEKEQQLQQQVVAQLGLDRHTPLAQPVTASEASVLAGVPLTAPGLYFLRAGWLRPSRVCAALLDHPNIETRCNTRVTDANHRDGQWQLGVQQDPEPHAFDALVLCTANSNRQFAQTAPLPLQPIRGQVSFAAATDTSQKLKLALCAEGYIAPENPGQGQSSHSFGATFKLKQTDTDIRAEEHEDNLRTLATLLPDIADEFRSQPLRGRAALRAATPDYLPMAGPVAEWEALEATYHPLRKNRKQRIDQRTPYQPNLYVMAGLGSRGFTYAPLAAEVLAGWISGGVMPVSQELVKALHPMRFAIRALGKNRPLHD